MKKKVAKKYDQCLEVSQDNKKYLNLSLKRSKGHLPHMEVAKAFSKLLKKDLKNKTTMLDVGCLSGHFLRTFREKNNKNFFYQGLDPFDLHINAAKKVWEKDKNSSFKVGWAQKIPFKQKKFDITICSNVFTHIPNILNPIKELIRVTRKKIIIRTPIHNKSYRIQMVFNNKWWKYTSIKPENEFDKKGNPRSFEYYDVHSKEYFSSVIKKFHKKAKISYVKDDFFSSKMINNPLEKKNIPTKVINNMQVTDLMIVPNYFVIIKI